MLRSPKWFSSDITADRLVPVFVETFLMQSSHCWMWKKTCLVAFINQMKDDHTTNSHHLALKVRENVLFELESERVIDPCQMSDTVLFREKRLEELMKGTARGPSNTADEECNGLEATETLFCVTSVGQRKYALATLGQRKYVLSLQSVTRAVVANARLLENSFRLTRSVQNRLIRYSKPW